MANINEDCTRKLPDALSLEIENFPFLNRLEFARSCEHLEGAWQWVNNGNGDLRSWIDLRVTQKYTSSTDPFQESETQLSIKCMLTHNNLKSRFGGADHVHVSTKDARQENIGYDPSPGEENVLDDDENQQE
ncbi:MAG: hypothetical protein M1824_000289 [Vezdaea acicularis]|nr:MAG: hypothetical protein M1824_000289 [Vezdaea acicularis]